MGGITHRREQRKTDVNPSLPSCSNPNRREQRITEGISSSSFQHPVILCMIPNPYPQETFLNINRKCSRTQFEAPST
jgi:hypothetical protein